MLRPLAPPSPTRAPDLSGASLMNLPGVTVLRNPGTPEGKLLGRMGKGRRYADASTSRSIVAGTSS